ncbi:MAG TPA: DUF1801 domain-containing protein [Gemmatimonadaceae bacterium]|jgi:hypothetical protein
MAELKTKATTASVDRFLAGIKDKRRREDCLTVAKLMQQVTKAPPRMWGSSIVGFGDYTYHYESGRELSWFLVGFSPRKDALTLYLMPGSAKFSDALANLGKHKSGKACLYIKSLEDVDQAALKTLVQESVKRVKEIARERKR